ncbi:MAG TPA: hypothetical protein PLL25_01395 [Flavobacteriales bacterium]|jgi:hypothetical protein|nr:hypothetical protein [Flavobacteriales bacterium]
MAIGLVVLFTAVLSIGGSWQGGDGQGWKGTIRSDAKGYYGYLQAIFLRHDLGHEPFQWEYVKRTPNGTLNKYFAGTAVTMAPWFAVGHALALTDPDAPRNGLSEYEMKALFIGAWCYLLLGLLALRALLIGLGIREGVIAWVVLAFGLGSTLLQMAGFQPAWSHIHSFCAIAIFLLLVQRIATGADLRWSVVAGALFGLIVLIRPVNGLLLLAIPVVAGKDLTTLLTRLRVHPGTALGAMLASALVIGIQPLLWKLQTGNWLEYGYGGEGFLWTRPEVFKVLFGFRRGLFLWTPVLLLSGIGTLLLWRWDRTRAAWLLVYWVSNVYVISSWWIWYYGSGFGARVFVDHYPVLAIPMALLLQRTTTRTWILARLFIVACIVLHLFQLWQYHTHILHHECMDRAKYVWAFGRHAPQDRGQLGGNYQEAPYHPNGMDVIIEESCDLDNPCTYWGGGHRVEDPKAFTGKHVCVYDEDHEFGITFTVPPGIIPPDRDLFLEVGYQRYEAVAGESGPALGITVVQAEGRDPAYYEPFRINPLPGQKNDHWQQIEYRIPVPALADDETLKFYLWNKDLQARFMVDDVFMRVSAVRPY